MKPFDYQEADIVDLLANDMSGFVVAETGGGKTLIGAESARRSGLPTKLIIAPQGTHKRVWKRTILDLDPEAHVARIDSTDAGKKAMDDLEWKEPGYYLMTPQLFTRWKPLHLRPDLMIVDEAHLLGNWEKPGGRALMKMGRTAVGHVIPMSGTMVRNHFETLWTLLRTVYPDRNEPGDIADISHNRWIDDHCATKYDHFAPGQRVVTGELEPGTLASLVPCWRQHFKRAECCEFHPEGFLAHLPEPIVIREVIELTPGQKKAMTQMQRDYLAYLEVETAEWKALPVAEQKKRALVTNLPVVRELRLSQMTLAMPSVVPREWKGKRREGGVVWMGQDGVEYQWTEVDGHAFMQALDDRTFPEWDVVFAPDADSPKLEKLIELWQKDGEPMVAATNSRKFAEMALPRIQAAGIRAALWSGGVTEKNRDQILTDFIAGKFDIVLGVVEAIGTGIDGLQEAAGILVSLNKSRDLAMETQLEGRLDRRGQTRVDGVIHYEIIAEGSTDEEIIDSQLERRLSLNKSLRKALTKELKNMVGHAPSRTDV